VEWPGPDWFKLKLFRNEMNDSSARVMPCRLFVFIVDHGPCDPCSNPAASHSRSGGSDALLQIETVL